MKSSPFDTYADFSSATGAIHTFATTPAVIYLCIGLSAAICVLLVVRSFLTKH